MFLENPLKKDIYLSIGGFCVVLFYVALTIALLLVVPTILGGSVGAGFIAAVIMACFMLALGVLFPIIGICCLIAIRFGFCEPTLQNQKVLATGYIVLFLTADIIGELFNNPNIIKISLLVEFSFFIKVFFEYSKIFNY